MCFAQVDVFTVSVSDFNLQQWKCSCRTYRQNHLLLCPHLVKISIQYHPELRHIHYSRVSRNQFPPYLSIDCIHGARSNASITSTSNEPNTSNAASLEETSPEISTVLIEQFENIVRDAGISENGELMEDLPTIGDVMER